MDPSKLTKDPRYRRLSLRIPVILFTVVLVLIVTLTILWHVALVNDYQKLRALARSESFHWSFIALGSVLFLGIIVLSIILGVQLIGHIRWSQRQANFIASVSHELNSPLSAIKLFAQTLRRPDMGVADRLNFVEKILSDVERLQRLIANILRAAEVDNRGDALPVVPRRIELAGYLSDYLADFTTLGKERRLNVELDADDDFWVRLDPIMFRQVLDNLMDNAIRYRGAQDPVVKVGLEDDGGYVVVTVADQGVGVEASELPSLFDRFYQVADHHGQGGRKGTGIGLFVVRSIVQAHGGTVEAQSAGLGQGTEIRIRLPRSPTVLPAALPAAAPERPAAEPPPRLTTALQDEGSEA